MADNDEKKASAAKPAKTADKKAEKKPAEKKPAEKQAEKKPAAAAAAEKKPASKAAEKKPATKGAADKPAAEKKPTTKAAAEKKPAAEKAEKSVDTAAEKKPAAKKPAASKTTAPAEKKPAARSKASTSGSSTTEGAGGTLKAHHLRPAPGAHTPKTRVGRGEAGKGGKTAGRGTKGTKARNQVPERFEGGQMPLHMRLPKLRGFKNPFRTEYQVVNVGALATLYPKGGEVTVEDLVSKGAVRKGAPVKVLGEGDVDVKLTVTVQKVSASAREKILAAGGTISQD